MPQYASHGDKPRPFWFPFRLDLWRCLLELLTELIGELEGVSSVSSFALIARFASWHTCATPGARSRQNKRLVQMNMYQSQDVLPEESLSQAKVHTIRGVHLRLPCGAKCLGIAIAVVSGHSGSTLEGLEHETNKRLIPMGMYQLLGCSARRPEKETEFTTRLQRAFQRHH